MATITAKNIGRINVWPTYAVAQEADTAESKFTGQLTVWRTNEEAKANISHEEGGGGGAPVWVPANAVIHIDLVGGSPQGRAWVEGTGEVAVDTLLNFFNPESLVPEVGLLSQTDMNPIGDALTLLLGSFTCRIRYLWQEGESQDNYTNAYFIRDATNGYALQLDLDFPIQRVRFQGYNEIDLRMESAPLNYGALADAYNVVAFTLTTVADGGRLEFAVNGSTVTGGVYDVDDRPVANPFVFVLVAMENLAMQSITLYDPLPSTAGLSELSEV